MSVTFSGQGTGQLHRRLSGLSGQARVAPATRSGRPALRPGSRVRQEVRDGLAVFAFTAVASSALALALATLTHVAG